MSTRTNRPGHRVVVPLALAATLFAVACTPGDNSEGGLEDVDLVEVTTTTVDNSGTTAGNATASASADTETTAADTTQPESSTTETTQAPEGPSPLDGLTVRVDQEVKFETGGTSATVEGAVIRGERDVYRLEANAGQQLNLAISSLEDNGVFDLYSPDGSLIANGQVETSVQLPATGEYIVLIGGIRGNVSYTLDISIPA